MPADRGGVTGGGGREQARATAVPIAEGDGKPSASANPPRGARPASLALARGLRPERGRLHVAASELRVLDSFPSGAEACRWPRPLPGFTGPPTGPGVLRDEYGPVSIECGAAQAEHGRARHRRAGQDELPGGDLRRGPRARAVRPDPVRPEGRRRGCRHQPRGAVAHLHGARLRAPDVRLQPARGRRARRRDRRLRRGGAAEPVLRRRHPGFVRPLPAQRGDRGARV